MENVIDYCVDSAIKNGFHQTPFALTKDEMETIYERLLERQDEIKFYPIEKLPLVISL